MSTLRIMSDFHLHKSLVEEFVDKGVVVIPSVLSCQEVNSARNSFHECLFKYGIDIHNLEDTASNLSRLSTTGGAGGILDIFYEDWKLRLNEHPRIVSCISELWRNTYATCDGIFKHPFGTFNPNISFMYIDRVCYRLPECLSARFSMGKRKLQRTLAPHLDCCPHKLYEFDKDYPKWRPIQAFIALSDTLHKDQGGFEACCGLHKRFDDWVANRIGQGPLKSDENSVIQQYQLPPPCLGDFTPIRPQEDKDIISNFEHIPCRAGDLVCWDIRIPHANSRYNHSSLSREAVYIGLLPWIPLNKTYTEYQLSRYLEGKPPSDQWHGSCRVENNSHEFSELGRKMMTLDSYSCMDSISK